MGIYQHHAVIVTSWNKEAIQEAHAVISTLYADFVCHPSEILASRMNGYRSFVIPPDGSKEGWEESEEGNRLRKLALDHLDSRAYSDGSSPLCYVEVAFGELRPSIERTNT